MPTISTFSPPNPQPPDRPMGRTLLITTCVLTVFTVITTLLRAWARHERRRLGRDDYAIMCCCSLAVIRTCIQIVSVQHGNGRHRWRLSQSEYQYVNFLTWLTQLFLFTNIALLKCSICMLILRVKNERTMAYFLNSMMLGLVLTNLLPIVVLLAECDPPEKYWKPATSGKCWPTKIRIYSIYLQVAYSVITDLICALLPIAVVWKIQISPSTKVGVCGLMSLGLIATAVAIVRASSLGIKTSDLSYDYCIAAIWANTELHLGIIATNMSLSRMIWSVIRNRPKPDGAYSANPHASTSHSRSGYVKSTASRVRQDPPGTNKNTRESEEMQPIMPSTITLSRVTVPARARLSSADNERYAAR